ncbi:MAG: MlaD family protein [Rubrivivax sp.]|jgi:paraquat-inducible protein B|nr:MlaD family protein [Rubrivivax sp.]
MRSRALAWRVGLFALGGLMLAALAVSVVGGRWFAPAERAAMRFETSVYGLQVGAPVVLRGVRIGQVASIGLEPAGPQGAAIPVVAEFDRALLLGLLGPEAPERGAAMPVLLQQGLVARLATQSLLTGLLYVDLDFDPGRRAAPPAVVDGRLPLIPTAPTRLQTLQAQLEGIDLGQLARDLAGVAAAARQLLAEPGTQSAPTRLGDAATALQALAARIEREVGPLAAQTRATLAAAEQSLGSVGPAAGRVGEMASRVEAAASEVQSLAAAGRPLAAEMQRAADELARSAATLREAAAEDSALRLHADRALQDVARAARSLRELGETLERNPDAFWRGRDEATR